MLNKYCTKIFFKCKQLRSTLRLTNYNVSNLALIVYCFSIKILIDATLRLLYCLNLFLASNLLILQLSKLLRLNLLLN